jgi:SAM-dependent methyltransferase
MTAAGNLYTSGFYAGIVPGARRSADVVVPRLLDLVRPRSVIDVGCGIGSWLAAFRRLGVDDVFGVDGHHVDVAALEIPSASFRAVDLRQPLTLGRAFDLVVSLEVAEHLPAESAAGFVESLTRLGPVVAFSAAVPAQGGVGHVNEQWPDYWIRLFDQRDFAVVDALRSALWTNDEVDWWYAQNILLFVSRRDRRHQELGPIGGPAAAPLPLVHPRLYAAKVEHVRASFRAVQEIEEAVPRGAPVALADDYQLAAVVHGRLVSHFPERDGAYAGPPEDDAAAGAALERARAAGVQFLVFAWSSFWWFDHYRTFVAELQRRFRCVTRSEQVVVFDLREPTEPPRADHVGDV